MIDRPVGRSAAGRLAARDRGLPARSVDCCSVDLSAETCLDFVTRRRGTVADEGRFLDSDLSRFSNAERVPKSPGEWLSWVRELG